MVAEVTTDSRDMLAVSQQSYKFPIFIVLWFLWLCFLGKIAFAYYNYNNFDYMIDSLYIKSECNHLGLCVHVPFLSASVQYHAARGLKIKINTLLKLLTL